MSGPKYDEVDIEAERRREMERKRQEELKRLVQAREDYLRAVTDQKNCRKKLESMIAQLDTYNNTRMEREISRFRNELSSPSQDYGSDTQAYKDAASRIDSIILSFRRELEDRIREAIEQGNISNSRKQSNAAIQEMIQSANNDGGEKGLPKISMTSGYEHDLCIGKIKESLEHYREVAVSADDPEHREYAREASRYLEEILENGISDDGISKIREWLQNLTDREQDLIREVREKNALYQEYSALCVINGNDPKPNSDFRDRDSLEQETAKQREEYAQRDELDYIADQINDVLLSLGHKFVSSVVLEQGTKEVDYSIYQSDDKSGIAVYTRQDGTVQMTMVVLGKNTDITEKDRQYSLERQIDFCAHHKDITKALAERGILLKQKNHEEPDQKHTYKISVSESIDQMKQSGDTLGEGKRRGRRRRRSEKQRNKMRTV